MPPPDPAPAPVPPPAPAPAAAVPPIPVAPVVPPPIPEPAPVQASASARVDLQPADFEAEIPTTQVSVPDREFVTEEIQVESNRQLQQVEQVGKAIVDQTSYSEAVKLGTAIKAYKGRVEERMERIVKPARAAWQEANNLKKELVKPLDEALRFLRDSCSTYRTEMERRRREEEERRQAEIRRQQEERERLRREAEERARKEREEWERQEAERQRKIREEEEKRLKEAEEAKLRQAVAAEEAGDAKRADKILEAPAPVAPAAPLPPPIPKPAPAATFVPPPAPAPPPPALTPKVEKAGEIQKVVWKARIDDPMEFLKGIIALKVPVDLIEIKQGALNKLAVKKKSELNLPGVTAYPENQTQFK